MKKLKIFLGLFVCAFMVVPFMGVNAETTVNTYDELVAALKNGGEIVLGKSIDVTGPLSTDKDVTLNGNGNTLKAVYTGTSGNQTIITSTAGTLTLQNISLTNSPKYGVQAYNGGNVVLDGVTISNHTDKFGAVNINGGTVTIKDLTMTDNVYGIEFAAGLNVTGTPALIMDGVIKGNQKDVLYVDIDQITADKTISVENTENSTQKISLKDNTIVLMEGDKVLATSNELATGTTVDVDGEKLQAEEPAKEPTTPEEPKDENNDVKDEVENPKTSDGIMITVAALAVSAVIAVIAKKKLA